MNGPFGGALTHHDGVTREALAPEFAAALVAAHAAAWPRPGAPDVGGAPMARAVFFSHDDAGVSFEGDLTAMRPLFGGGVERAEALRALVLVGRCLAHLHARGVVHGDLRPELVWAGASGDVALLVPSQTSGPGAPLRARMHPGGAAPTSVAFAAPEVAAAYEATAASDTFALAAITYAALTGYPPLGQVGLATSGADELARLVDAAMHQSPAARPAHAALVAAMERAASTAATPQPTPGAPYRGVPRPMSSAAEAEHAQRATTEVSGVLMLVLLGGGFCAFVGAVLLVVAGWEVVGAWGRVGLLAGLAGASWGAGALAKRLGVDTGVTVARALAGLFATVGLAYAFHLLDAPGRLALLIALTVGSFVGGAEAERRGAPLGGAVLLALGSQLVWTVGAQLVDILHLDGGAGAAAAVAGVVSAVTLALAARRGSAAFSSLAALDLAVFFGAFGEWLRTGAVMGPSMYALAVAGGYAAVSAGLSMRAQEGAAVPMAIGAALAASLSALLGVVVMNDHWSTHGLAGAAWPFAVLAASMLATRATRPLSSLASLTSLALVAFAPSVEAMLRPDDPWFTRLAIAVGAATLAAALFAPTLRRDDDARPELLLAGLFGAVASPSLWVLRALDHRGDGAWPADGDGAHWVTMGAVSAGLLALSYASTSRVSRGRYRMLEIAALAQLFGLLTLQTLVPPYAVAPAALVIACGAALLTLGWVTRRAAVLVMSATALVVDGWIQYFERLAGMFPVSVRLVGFGVGLLVGGVLYEQQVRHRLSRLRDWR